MCGKDFKQQKNSYNLCQEIARNKVIELLVSNHISKCSENMQYPEYQQ